jgi:hypothetical protein
VGSHEPGALLLMVPAEAPLRGGLAPVPLTRHVAPPYAASMTKILLATVALLVLAGCGGSGGKSYDDAQSVADAAGMSGCKPDTNVMSSDAVFCKEGRANWFKSDNALSQWKQIADSVGVGGEILYGSNWAIECNTKSFCDSAKAKLGGTLG